MAKKKDLSKQLSEAIRSFSITGKGSFTVRHKNSVVESWSNVGGYFEKSFKRISDDRAIPRKEELELN